MGRQSTGIRDVARHLRLSVSTVPRAMNNRADVSAATRTLVREASLAPGYAPDQSGRSLRHGTTDTVALTIRTGNRPHRFPDDRGVPFVALGRQG